MGRSVLVIIRGSNHHASFVVVIQDARPAKIKRMCQRLCQLMQIQLMSALSPVNSNIIYTGRMAPTKMVETIKQIIIISGYIMVHPLHDIHYILKDVRNQRLLLLLNVVREIYTLFG